MGVYCKSISDGTTFLFVKVAGVFWGLGVGPGQGVICEVQRACSPEVAVLLLRTVHSSVPDTLSYRFGGAPHGPAKRHVVVQ